MDLLKFKSSVPESNFADLPAGRYNFTIESVRILESDRIKSLDGERKTQAELDAAGVDYVDEHPQALLGLITEDGVRVFHRQNVIGFERFDDLSDTTGYFRSSHPLGYAVDVETKRRLVSPKNEKAALNILNSIFAACEKQNEDGSWEPLPSKGAKFTDLPGCRLSAVYTPRTWQGRAAPPDIGSWRRWGYEGSALQPSKKVLVIKAKEVDDNF